jgi:hypothetical protein
MARRLPDGVGRLWRKGERPVLHTHYHKTGRGAEVAFYFARGPVKQSLALAPVKTNQIRIPPGDAAHKVATSWVVPRDAFLFEAWPHTHLIGKSISAVAVLPDGTRKDIIVIRDWNFEWQETYQFKQPLALPRGTRVELEAVYDNSESNPNNPWSPPRMVAWGEQTTDEMCAVALGLTFSGEARSLKPK